MRAQPANLILGIAVFLAAIVAAQQWRLPDIPSDASLVAVVSSSSPPVLWGYCGDAIVQSPNQDGLYEQCDNGDFNSNTSQCTLQCQWARCGDGHWQIRGKDGAMNTSDDEDCDDGNQDPSDTCTSSCKYARCGDDIVQPFGMDGRDGTIDDEECEIALDGEEHCTPFCRLPICGDGYAQPGSEECDPATFASSLCPPAAPMVPQVCNALCDCVLETTCGDTIVQRDEGEECDDGKDGDNEDECTDWCMLPFCGDNIIQESQGERCDGFESECDFQLEYCTTDCQCTSFACGDGGLLDPHEECDDGNNVSGDGCSSTCLLETVCGNGKKEGVEECDDGNTYDYDGCSRFCRLEVCGDGYIQPPEQCDDGNANDGDGCSSTCLLETVCGNGKKEGVEECDDGNTYDYDGCSRFCLFKEWGDEVPADSFGLSASVSSSTASSSLWSSLLRFLAQVTGTVDRSFAITELSLTSSSIGFSPASVTEGGFLEATCGEDTFIQPFAFPQGALSTPVTLGLGGLNPTALQHIMLTDYVLTFADGSQRFCTITARSCSNEDTDTDNNCPTSTNEFTISIHTEEECSQGLTMFARTPIHSLPLRHYWRCPSSAPFSTASYEELSSAYWLYRFLPEETQFFRGTGPYHASLLLMNELPEDTLTALSNRPPITSFPAHSFHQLLSDRGTFFFTPQEGLRVGFCTSDAQCTPFDPDLRCSTSQGDCNPYPCEEGQICPEVCTGFCVFPQPTCGNARTEAGEACDDGNTASDDGCSTLCTVEFPWQCTTTPIGVSVCTLLIPELP